MRIRRSLVAIFVLALGLTGVFLATFSSTAASLPEKHPPVVAPPAGVGRDGSQPGGMGYDSVGPGGMGYDAGVPGGMGYDGVAPGGMGYDGARPGGVDGG